MPGFSEKTATVNGKKVRYFTNGVKGGRPVVILHGFMSDATGLIPFAESMALDQPVIIPDLPGFGESGEGDKTKGLSSYVVWLDSFLNEIQANPRIIVGYSFGAYIAVMYTSRYARNHKDMKLVLLTPVMKIRWQVRVYGRGFRFMAFRNRKLAERLWLLQYDFTTIYIRKNRHPAVQAQLIERRRGELEYLNPELVLKLFSEFLEVDLMPYAQKLKVPVVMVLASNDNLAANNASRRFASMISSPITVVEIHHAGHLLPIEEPTLLGVSIKNYFA